MFYRPGKFIQTKIKMIHWLQKGFRQVQILMMIIYPFRIDIGHLFFLIVFKCVFGFLKIIREVEGTSR